MNRELKPGDFIAYRAGRGTGKVVLALIRDCFVLETMYNKQQYDYDISWLVFENSRQRKIKV